MRSFLASSVAALAMIASAASAQDFSAQRLSDEIRIISADDFQGRKPGTEGERKTLEFLQTQYEAMGLAPEVLNHLRPGMLAQARQLRDLD